MHRHNFRPSSLRDRRAPPQSFLPDVWVLLLTDPAARDTFEAVDEAGNKYIHYDELAHLLPLWKSPVSL